MQAPAEGNASLGKHKQAKLEEDRSLRGVARQHQVRVTFYTDVARI